MRKDAEGSVGGLHLKKLIYIMVVISILISALLSFTTFRTENAYNELYQVTGEFIEWQLNVSDMKIASDYLTEQVRCFAETGEDQYLDNYFTELNETRRRDNALEALRDEFEGTELFYQLEDAMLLSETLTDREFFCMKVKLVATGRNPDDYPQQVRDYKLTEHVESLPQNQLDYMARRIVFDAVYRSLKNSINVSVENCMKQIQDEIDTRQQASINRLHDLIFYERLLIIVLIIDLILMVTTVILAVIKPVVKAVPHITEGEKIPEEGSYEFRFLAKTYNEILETNSKQKVELEHAALHDQLTGVLNRSGFDSYLRTLNFNTTTLLIIDVDNFKEINDTYGHTIGDSVLKRVTDTVRTHFRSDDIVCRIGGDEFVVFMRQTGPDQKDLIIRKISDINDSIGVPIGNIPAISISVGAAFGRNLKPEDVFKKADKALYESKENGRSCCTYYE